MADGPASVPTNRSFDDPLARAGAWIDSANSSGGLDRVELGDPVVVKETGANAAFSLGEPLGRID